MTAYDPLEPYRFAKRHDFAVQECRALDVREVMAWLDIEHRGLLAQAEAQASATIRVAGWIGPYRDPDTIAAYEDAACPNCKGDGCRNCSFSGCRCRGAGCLACTSYGSNRVGDLAEARRQGSDRRDLVLMVLRCGAARRWHMICPACGRPREHLYLPPGELVWCERNDSLYAPPRGEWRCRRCWNLNYASQHYGRTHPLRRQPAPRRALSRRRRLAKANRHRQRRFGTTPVGYPN